MLTTPEVAFIGPGGPTGASRRGTLQPPPPPPPPLALPPPPSPPPPAAGVVPGPGYQIPAALAPTFACIRRFESNDNYQESANPGYRGAYQFSWTTWRWLGGRGDPAAAPPWLQDYMAVQLWQRQGWSAWETAPLCGV